VRLVREQPWWRDDLHNRRADGAVYSDGVDAGSVGVESSWRKNAGLDKTGEMLKATTPSPARVYLPATEVICRFVADHRNKFGVAPICRIAPSAGARSPRQSAALGACARYAV